MDENPNQSKYNMSGSMPSPGSNRPSPSVPHHRRFDGMNNRCPSSKCTVLIVAESWVELSSQPSSSSLSSVGDEIVTTGLHVGSPFHRRRRLPHSARSVPIQQSSTIHPPEVSSQDEEDESESEEDQVMSSSAENIHSSERDASGGSDQGSDDEDDGDNETTLGRTSDAPVFRPHPNAFSHPPTGLNQRSHSTNSSMPPHPHSEFRRASYPHRSHTRIHRGAPSFMSPTAREDNDAALRASLTTLLSCAAAARGLPKSKEETAGQRTTRTGVGPSNQPLELRFVQESDLNDESNDKEAAPAPARARPSSPGRSPTSTTAAADKPKRSGSAGRSPRAAKKKKTAVVSEDAMISPTLFTWVVSAGVVVLVSVVGFGAGYVIGREVGRQEAQEALAASVSGVNETTSAGRDVIRSSGGLRKLRWGAVGKSIVAQA